MSKYLIRYLPIAEKDLTEIIEYVYMDKPHAARKLLNQLDKTIAELEDFPFMGKTPQDTHLGRLKYRVVIVDNYLIFYVVRRKVVEIRRIVHGKRKYGFLGKKAQP